MARFSKFQLSEYFSRLDKDRDIIKILSSIDLSDEFLLDIVFVDDINDTQIIKLFLKDRLEEDLVVLPSGYLSTYQEYVDEFFYPLYEMRGNDIKDGILILDMTFLDKNRLYDTERFLIRLNELRNHLTNQIDKSIIMIIPQDIKELFIRFSQDTWTVRTIVASVKIGVKSDPPKEIKNHNKEEKKPKDSDKINRLYKEHQDLKNRKDDITIRLLMINCGEIGDYYFQTASLNDSMSYYKKALKLSKKISKIRPDSIEARRDMSVYLSNVADIYLQKDDATKALKHYQKSLKIVEQIRKIRPESIEAKRDMSISLNNVAKIYLQQGDALKALSNYQESLELAEKISKTRPENIVAKRDLSVSLNKVADIYLQQGEASKALNNYQKSVELIEEISKMCPENIETKRDLSVSIIKLAEVYKELGDISKYQSYLNDAENIHSSRLAT